jgi:hypothetical protein
MALISKPRVQDNQWGSDLLSIWTVQSRSGFQSTESITIRDTITSRFQYEKDPDHPYTLVDDTETISRGIYADLVGISRKYHISIPDPDAVISYLQHYPDIIDVLWNAAKYSLETFEKRAEISLEISTGDDSCDTVLALFVRMAEYPEDIIEQLDSVCEQFEQDLIERDGFILITTDFLSPIIK